MEKYWDRYIFPDSSNCILFAILKFETDNRQEIGAEETNIRTGIHNGQHRFRFSLNSFVAHTNRNNRQPLLFYVAGEGSWLVYRKRLVGDSQGDCVALPYNTLYPHCKGVFSNIGSSTP